MYKNTKVHLLFHLLINNSRNHAKATSVNIDISFENGNLLFKYEDNGCGFDLNALNAQNHRGMGLINIENRLKSMNTTGKMLTKPKKGFKFECEIIVNPL